MVGTQKTTTLPITPMPSGLALLPVTAFFALFFAACSNQPETTSRRTAQEIRSPAPTPSGSDGTSEIRPPKSSSTQIPAVQGERKNESITTTSAEPSASTQMPAPSPAEQVPSATIPSGSEKFFNEQVAPLFRTSCRSCHAEPREATGVVGPLTIYSFKNMRERLGTGSSSVANSLIDKVQGRPSHAGGDTCRGSTTLSPCKELVEWWKMDFGLSTSDTGLRLGRVLEVSAGGRVYGWAINPKNPAEQVMVKVYVGGVKGTGIEAGMTGAFVNGDDENTPGDHAFIFELPTQFRSGKRSFVHVYAVVDGVETLLNSEPLNYQAWVPTPAGEAYFMSTVAPTLASCNSCHNGKNYQAYYGNLFNKPPSLGGSALNNELINKISGSNGVTHSGGRPCSSAAASPCNLLQNWWQLEFGGSP